MEQTKRITPVCYVAGQSGGHIIPCLTLAARVKEEQPQTSIIFFSSNGNMDQTILQGNNIVDHHIQLAFSQKRSLLSLPIVGLHLMWALLKSFYLLAYYRPSRIISTGGIVAVPVSIAGWLLRIPIDLYELNATPGKAMKVLAPFATTLYVCFAQAKRYFPQAVLTQYPIRFDTQTSKLATKFSPDRLTIFIQGGSQGSRFLNHQIKMLIKTYVDSMPPLQLIHQTGSDRSVDWELLYKKYEIPAHVFSYDHDVASYYEQANLIICRSGAGALFESLYFQTPCITIPLETKKNTHQLDNAQAIATEYPELFTMIRQDENVVEKLYAKLMEQLRYKKQNKQNCLMP